MTGVQINSIDQVITLLDEIISESEKTNDTLGYFAALYRNVTIKVKEGIQNNFFDDGPRMEKLDIVFAKRYLDAYYAWQKKEKVTQSWQKSFELSTNYWPIVLQHLLIGINTHINLDLGIAAAEISKSKNINDLENDFNKINDILSSLVMDVQNDLADMWPTLRKILQKTKNVDDFFVDFSMQLARDGAWKFALLFSETDDNSILQFIETRDQKVVEKVRLVINPGFPAGIIFKIIRLGERGNVGKRIRQLATV